MVKGRSKMLSTIKDDKYIILEDDCVYPDEYDKEKLDSVLARLKQAYSALADTYAELNEFFPEIECLVRCHGIDVCEELRYIDDEGRLFTEAAKGISEFQESLNTHNDEIPKAEERMTLRDLGFSCFCPLWYERIIEESEEKDIVEEIQVRSEASYRRRTTLWEKTDYGRSSREITYETLPITDELRTVIENTRKNDSVRFYSE